MVSPQVYLAIPSANPEKCLRNLPAWKERGYRIAVLQNHVRAEIPADIVVWSDHYPGWADSINILARTIVPRSASIIVSGGDDMLPDPDHSAEELARQFLQRFPDAFGVMQPHGDSFLQARQYCGSPWFGRAWCDHMYGGTGPMWPGYRHNWADNELYWVSKCLGRLWERPDLSQHHAHFSRDGKPPEDYWTRNVSAADRADVQLFIARSWQNFPGHAPRAVDAQFDVELFVREYSRAPEAYWISRYGAGDEAASAMGRALQSCARQGYQRVAIYGAGTHTRAAAAVLMDSPVKIECIIDDSPLFAGRALWNFPIVTLAQAQDHAFDAVVLSSKSMEQELARAAQPLARKGIAIMCLYSEERAVA